LLDPDASPLGTLRAHLARANPQWRSLDREQEALVVFQAADSYITPSWYAAKREHGKVVPTWNYAVVQAWGRPRVIDDREWLARQIRALTGQQEVRRADLWAVDDAPEPFVAAQLKGIVGVEIPIARIEGKWKVSQNRPPEDRAGVAQGLEGEGDSVSRAMARLVRERAQPAPPTGGGADSPSR
jgi:transcriptional regulator